jgi:uncharacterized protein YsxB (DUF464 family)
MRNGFLSAKLPRETVAEKREQVQLLLESMVVMLQAIEESYGEYIEVQDQSNEEGGRPRC